MNGKKKIILTVGEDLIYKSRQFRRPPNPILLAIRLVFPDAEIIENNRIALDLFDLDCEEVPLPKVAIDFIEAFERGEEVKPIHFQLELCTPFTEEMIEMMIKYRHLEFSS